jgi:dTDP-4-amino-4,6-dideoxygalactose transaminase
MVIHYVPLHLSQAGRRFGRAHGTLKNTEDLSARLLRLPLWIGLGVEATDRVLACFPTLPQTA